MKFPQWQFFRVHRGGLPTYGCSYIGWYWSQIWSNSVQIWTKLLVGAWQSSQRAVLMLDRELEYTLPITSPHCEWVLTMRTSKRLILLCHLEQVTARRAHCTLTILKGITNWGLRPPISGEIVMHTSPSRALNHPTEMQHPITNPVSPGGINA